MKPLFYLIHAGLLALLVYQGMAVLYPGSVIPDISSDHSQPSLAAAKSGNTPKPGNKKELSNRAVEKAILDRNLFKVLTDEPTPGLSPPPVLKKTQLKLALEGTVTGQRESENWAVIKDKLKRGQSLFQVGDHIQGATIKEILRSKVILTVNGKDQILVPDTKSKSHAPGKQASLPPGISQDPGDPLRLGTDPVKDRTPLLKEVKSRPYLRNGQPAGILIYGIRPDSDLLGMGLKNGDIIQEVNGETIQTGHDLNNAPTALGPESKMIFTLIRRGRKNEIVYHVQTDAFTIQEISEE